MKFEDIKDYEKFFNSLYSRLKSAKEDIIIKMKDSCYNNDFFLNNRELNVVEAIINWIDNYNGD